MTTVSVRRCDRCGSEIPQRSDGTRVTRYDRDYHGTTQDLCDKCKTAFQRFMDNEVTDGGIPKGYKRVARSCPHYVPCADPQGCDGHEVVPDSDPRPSLDK